MHEWKRTIVGGCSHENCAGGCTQFYQDEYAVTEDLTPPPGEGWVLASKFAVGRVKGAGESPPRPSR